MRMVASQLGYQELVIADSPAAYWPLDEGSGASSFASRAGLATALAITGSVSSGQPPLIGVGHSVRLASAADYLGVSNSVVADRSALTLEVWVKFGVSPTISNQVIVSRGYDGSDYSLSLSLNSGLFSVQVVYTSPTVAQTNCVSTIAPTTGSIYHLVGVWNPGSYLRLYVNGSQAKNVTTSASGMRSDSSGFFVGRSSHGGDDKTVDEIAAYGYALSAAKVAAHYAARAA